MFGREMTVPLDLMIGDPNVEEEDPVECTKQSSECPRYCDYVRRKQDKMRAAYTLTREHLRTTAVRAKKRYDMRVRPVQYQVGDMVWYHCPRKRMGLSPKWQKLYSGPYMITHVGLVNVRIQRSSKSKEFTTHMDKIKHCHTKGYKPWLSQDQEESSEAVQEQDRQAPVKKQQKKQGDRRQGRTTKQPRIVAIKEDEQDVDTVLISRQNESSTRPRRKIHRPKRFQ